MVLSSTTNHNPNLLPSVYSSCTSSRITTLKFVRSLNVQSMLKLGRAQGAAISAALYRDLPIYEYAPKKIKMAITGEGNASKEQVAALLSNILDIKELPKNLDATDGLAAAVCHYYQREVPGDQASYSSWKDFLNKNPNRKV